MESFKIVRNYWGGGLAWRPLLQQNVYGEGGVTLHQLCNADIGRSENGKEHVRPLRIAAVRRQWKLLCLVACYVRKRY